MQAVATLSSCCKKLESLDLSSNRLVTLPVGICDSTSISELRVNMNPLSAVPNLSGMRNLMHLGLARCGLTEVPAEVVTSLPKLATLDIARNYLRTLPPPNPKSDLTRLFAAFNQLECVLQLLVPCPPPFSFDACV